MYVEYIFLYLEEQKKNSKEVDQENIQYRKSVERQIDGGKEIEIKFKNENSHGNR